jgi:hypothetical protein
VELMVNPTPGTIAVLEMLPCLMTANELPNPLPPMRASQMKSVASIVGHAIFTVPFVSVKQSACRMTSSSVRMEFSRISATLIL